MEKKKKKRKNIKHKNEEQLVAVSPEPTSCSTLKVYISFKVKVGNECGKVE